MFATVRVTLMGVGRGMLGQGSHLAEVVTVVVALGCTVRGSVRVVTALADTNRQLQRQRARNE
jgi:hypothetical protein